MDLNDFAGLPSARKVFLVGLALGLGNTPEKAVELANEFLIAVGNPTPAFRTRVLLSLGLEEVTQTLEGAATWGRHFLRTSSLPWGTVSYGHAESIGRFLYLIAYTETLGPTHDDPEMSWYEQLMLHLGTVWAADSDKFLEHVTEACQLADATV